MQPANNKMLSTVAPVRSVNGDASDLLATSSAGASFSFQQLWRKLLRQKALFLLTLLLTLLAAALYSWTVAPQFRAVSMLQIEKEGAKVVEFGELSQPRPDLGDQDPFFRTRYEQLKSRQLAAQVIEELDLENRLFNRAFATPMKQKLRQQLDHMLVPVNQLLDKQPNAGQPNLGSVMTKADYVNQFLRGLYVEPVEKTHLVKVFYETPDPELSADIVNTLVDNFVSGNVDENSATGDLVQNVLDQELVRSRERLTETEQRLVDYARDNNILEVNNSQSTQEQKLNELNRSLAAAEQRQLEAENQLQQAQSHGSVPGLLASPVVEGLKQQLAELEGRYQNQLKIFKPAYPDMQQMAQEIQLLKRQLAAEQATLKQSLQAEKVAATGLATQLRRELDNYKSELGTLRDRSVEYNALQREVDTQRKLYEELLQRQEEVGVATASRDMTSMKVIDPADVPTESFKPNKILNMLIAFVVGSLLGAALALLRETMTNKIRSSDELQSFSGLPVLGKIPHISGSARQQLSLAASRQIGSPVAEAYRIAATNMRYINPDNPSQVILLTSVNPGEGKSTSSILSLIHI